MEYSLEQFLSLKKTFNTDKNVKILSSSMEPFIYKGDTVTVSPCELSKIDKGDAIIFWQDDKLICHLFFGMDTINSQEMLITKGINSRDFDDPVNPKFYLGLITSPRISFLKRILFQVYLFFKKP